MPWIQFASSFLRLGLILALASSLYAADATRRFDAPAAAGFGTVTGQISNESTGTYLEGAQVTVLGSDRMVVTDRQGRYRIQAPSGEAILSVVYVGLEEKKVPVSVRADATVNFNVSLTSAIYTLEPFRVEGEREGSAKAVTSQQTAMNVKNVASIDSLGNIADGNPGEFLHRLPGVAVDGDGAVVQRIAIRGITGALNGVTVDGDLIAAANSGTMTRAFEFDQASISVLDSIEVTKAPTPDMNANAIGGSVNLVTKSAFDRRDERMLLYTVAVVPQSTFVRRAERRIAQPIKGLSPSLNFTYSDVLGQDRRLGILITGMFYGQEELSTASVFTYQTTVNDPAYIRTVNLPRPIAITRIRATGSARVDYKLSDRTIITLGTQYNYAFSNSDTRTHSISTGTALAQFDANGNRIGTGTIRPGYTNTFTEALTGAATTSTITNASLDKVGRTLQLQPSIVQRFDQTKIDYRASWSHSNNYYDSHGPNTRHLDTKLKGSVTTSLPNIGWIVDRSKSLDWPSVTQTAGPDMYNLSNYRGLTLTDQTMMAEDELLNLRFNLRREIEMAAPTAIKVGASYSRQNHITHNSNNRFTYTGTNLGQFADTADRFNGSGVNRGYRRPPWLDILSVAQDIVDRPSAWTEDIAYRFSQKLQNERELTESVAAGYVMGQVKLGALGLLAGLRVEETRTDGEGGRNQITPEEKARRAAWVGALTPAEIERRAYAQYGGRIKKEGQYRNVFPGIHFRYAPTKGLVGRLSYSTSIGRPSIADVVPAVIVNYDNETINATNPGLKPQYSDNFDASVEYYFEPVGVISAGVFLKEVSNFIYADSSGVVGPGADNGFDGQYEGFRLTTDLNGGSARYRGFELNYQQQFTFLPGIWRGFGINANYTHLETRGDYGGRTTTTEVARFVPTTTNVGLSFNRDRLTMQLNLNYRGHFLNAISANPASTSYVDKRFLLAAKFRYVLTKKLSFFYDLDNVLKDTHIVHYVVNRERPIQSRAYVPKMTIGFQGRY